MVTLAAEVATCALMVQPITGLAACSASSGPKTAVLVELYTSEGCSSCPPADAQLGHLQQVLDPGADVVPLALHVNYWDYIGWKDPYAQAAFSVRHQWLVQANGHTTVFTPHFFVGGIESREWPADLRAQVRRQSAQPAQAKVELKGHLVRPSVMSVKAEAKLDANYPHAALYLALTESKLTSRVTRGENAGTTLAHDHVVRAWFGPVALRGGSMVIQQDVLLDPSWLASQLTAVAFVQDQDSGRALQAVSALSCAQP